MEKTLLTQRINENSRSAHNRIAWIDVAKGICMLSVIAGHLSVPIINKIVFPYHLTVFFILTGYNLKNNLSAEEAKKRFRNSMVPYFFTCFAVLAMDVINAVLANRRITLVAVTEIVARDLIRSFMASGTITTFGTVEIGSMIGAIWFFPAHFFAVLLAQMLLKYAPNIQVRYVAAVSLALIGIMGAKFIWLPFSIQSAMCVTPIVLLGYDAQKQNVFDNLSLRQVFFCLLVFVAGVVGNQTGIYFVRAAVSDWLLSGACAIASSVCVIFLAQKMEKCVPLAWIGRNSNYCLCLHLFEMNTLYSWFWKIRNLFGIPQNNLTLLVIKLLFITISTYLLLRYKDYRARRVQNDSRLSDRDDALDMAKAGLIVLMILGYFSINETFRRILYSFHMGAFIFYSGYCYRKKEEAGLARSIWEQVRRLLGPYALFGALHLLFTHDGARTEAIRLVCGISFSRRVFSDIASIGPVYFILLLFCTKVVYLVIDWYIHDSSEKAICILGLSLLGVCLGKGGYWLPWSFDCSLYALMIYFLGCCCKQYGIMKYIMERNYSYFMLSSIWAYAIYDCGMELAVRNYGVYSIAIMGAISGSILLYMSCRYFCGLFPGKLIRIFCHIGKSTIYILIVHCLLSDPIREMLAVRLPNDSAAFAVAAIIVQVLFGVLLSDAVSWFFPRKQFVF